MSEKNVTLSLNNESISLSTYSPTLGFDVIDIRSLGKQHYFTFDPGFYATAACESKITYIDCDKGILLYRGYSIDQLAAKCDYIDVSYLLVYGELPNASEKKSFEEKLAEAAPTCDLTKNLFSGFS